LRLVIRLQRRSGQVARIPEDDFRRHDETPDEKFYREPRFVTHIDDRAIAAVTQLYRELFPPGGEILDLMSSWVSHLPPEVEYRHVVGLGMNEEELRRNDRLDAYVVQNLNTNPRLPFGDAELDGVGICVSIDYLTRPVEVLREVGRVLRAAVLRYLLSRTAVSLQRRSTSGTNSTIRVICELVESYLREAGNWTNPEPRPQPPPHVFRSALRRRWQKHGTVRGRTRSALPCLVNSTTQPRCRWLPLLHEQSRCFFPGIRAPVARTTSRLTNNPAHVREPR
jgi:SAM-dependent methyltransferase